MTNRLVPRPSSKLRHLLLFGGSLLAALARAPDAGAQPAVTGDENPQGHFEVGLEGRMGIGLARRLLDSDDVADRIRGIERLGALGTDDATEALIEAVERNNLIGREPRARLAAIRALAPRAHKDAARALLVRELTESDRARRAGPASVGDLLRGTAALALARQGDDKCLAALGAAIRQRGTAAQDARAALLAYPPRDLDALVDPMGREKSPAEGDGADGDAKDGEAKKADKPTEKTAPPKPPAKKDKKARKPLPAAMAALLGDLGDLRAIPMLRVTLKSADATAQTAAALALARLGDEHAMSVARPWAKSKDARKEIAAAEVAATLGSAEAPAMVRTLLSRDATVADGVRLALAMPDPSLVPALVALARDATEEERARAVAALGAIGGAEAARALAKLLEDPSSAIATAAASALASSPGDEATDVLLAPLAKAKPGDRRAHLAARAAIVRELRLGVGVGDLGATLERMTSSSDLVDRQIAAFGLVATGRKDAADFGDRALAPAVARGLLARAEDDVQAMSPLLGAAPALSQEQAFLEVAAAVSLIGGVAPEELATSRLLDWTRRGGPLSPIAALVLGARDDRTGAARTQLRDLLGGTDPVLRAHTALGLGLDPEHDAASMLARTYASEERPDVRRAIVRALGMRVEPQRRAVLELARDFDPDAEVRGLARAALARRAGDQSIRPPRGRDVAWIRVVSSSDTTGASSPEGAHRAAWILGASGVAIPVVADADGVLLVPGLQPGPHTIRLAAQPTPENP